MYFNNTLTSLSEDSFSGCYTYNNVHGFDLNGIKRLGKIGNFNTFYAYNIGHAFDVIESSAFMTLAVAEGSTAA